MGNIRLINQKYKLNWKQTSMPAKRRLNTTAIFFVGQWISKVMDNCRITSRLLIWSTKDSEFNSCNLDLVSQVLYYSLCQSNLPLSSSISTLERCIEFIIKLSLNLKAIMLFALNTYIGFRGSPRQKVGISHYFNRSERMEK